MDNSHKPPSLSSHGISPIEYLVHKVRPSPIPNTGLHPSVLPPPGPATCKPEQTAGHPCIRCATADQEIAEVRETVAMLREDHDNMARLLRKLTRGPSGEEERAEMMSGPLFHCEVLRVLRDTAGSQA